MATFIIYATSPSDCLAFTAIATPLGKTATDGAALTAVRYDGHVSDVTAALERDAPNKHYFVAEVTKQVAWKSRGELSTVGDLIIGLV